MPAELTDLLCTRCGLCCDGSLFADVELASDAEAETLETLGIAHDTDDAEIPLLPLPCAALRGTRCSIYAHRPHTCRAFECRLLQETRKGLVTIESAQRSITEARDCVAEVNTLLTRAGTSADGLPLRERCAEALAAPPARTARARTARAALEAAMGELDWLLERVFLAPPRLRRGRDPERP